jgi:hypothetical protein
VKTYKNITNVDQLDIPPGETGQRDLLPDEEARMVDRGAIEVVGGGGETASEATSDSESPGDDASPESPVSTPEPTTPESRRGGRGRS